MFTPCMYGARTDEFVQRPQFRTRFCLTFVESQVRRGTVPLVPYAAVACLDSFSMLDPTQLP